MMVASVTGGGFRTLFFKELLRFCKVSFQTLFAPMVNAWLYLLVFAHVLFKAWIAQFEVKMKNAAQKLLVLIQAVRPGTGQAGPKAPGLEPAAVSPRK